MTFATTPYGRKRGPTVARGVVTLAPRSSRAVLTLLAANVASALPAQSDAAFGLRLRPPPTSVSAIGAPAVIREAPVGGREVLHAAVSANEGETWRGFREILHEPPVATRGDRDIAYASAAENAAGKIVVASGQGEGKRAIVAFDPQWLDQTETRDDLTVGPCGWTQYGSADLRVEALAGGENAVAIPLPVTGRGGASWNFPLAGTGELRFRVQISAADTRARFCLNDHFNRVDDAAASDHAVFNFDALPLADSGWHDVTLRWREAGRGGGELQAEVDGQTVGRIKAQRPAQFGVHTLRVEGTASNEEGRIRIAGLSSRRG